MSVKPEIKVEFWLIAKVKPYERNPRKNEAAVNATANSIREFGWRAPITVDKDGVIISGHTRLLAAKQLNLKEVPVYVAADLTPQQVKAYRIADNATAELATWDEDLLAMELVNLPEFDMSLFGLEDEIPNEEDAATQRTREIVLKPYRRVHYLVTIDIDKHDKLVGAMAALKKIEGVQIESTVN